MKFEFKNVYFTYDPSCIFKEHKKIQIPKKWAQWLTLINIKPNTYKVAYYLML
jgi:hypothetical protein